MFSKFDPNNAPYFSLNEYLEHTPTFLEAEDKKDLKSKLTAVKDELQEEERRITGNDPQFWTYLSMNKKMKKDSMIT